MKIIKIVAISFLSLFLITQSFSEDLEKVDSNKPILLVTKGCPFCTMMEKYLNSKNIEFQKFDIKTSKMGKIIHSDVGARGVPVTIIGSKVIEGYLPDLVDKALKIKEAEKGKSSEVKLL